MSAILMVAKLKYVSEVAYGRMIRSPWRIAPHVYTTLGTQPSRSMSSGRTSGWRDRAITLAGSFLSSRAAPIEYFRTGPTPCVSNSQPSSSSMGEPQFPI